MKTTKISWAMGLLALAACDSAPESPEIRETFALKCGGYDVVIEVVSGDTLNTTLNGEKIRMNRAISASGAKYEGKGAAVLAAMWSKGDNWTLHINDEVVHDCKPVAKKK